MASRLPWLRIASIWMIVFALFVAMANANTSWPSASTGGGSTAAETSPYPMVAAFLASLAFFL